MKHYENFDHHANGRIYFISRGVTHWAVNDVTDVRGPKAARIKGAVEAMKKFPSRWVAFADTKEDAIAAAELDALNLGERE